MGFWEVGIVSSPALEFEAAGSGSSSARSLLGLVCFSTDTSDTVFRGIPANTGNYRNSSLRPPAKIKDIIAEVWDSSALAGNGDDRIPFSPLCFRQSFGLRNRSELSRRECANLAASNLPTDFTGPELVN